MWIRSLCLCLCLGTLACDGCAGGERPASKPTTVTVPPATVVEGTVRLADGAELPRYAPADMERKILKQARRADWPEACTPPKVADREPVALTPTGALAGVLVAASEFNGGAPRPPKVHEVAIRDCRLQPALVAAVRGDVVRVTNEVDFPFMPSLGSDEVVRTLMPGQRFEFQLDQGAVKSLRCGFTAPCGRTDILTMYHPLFSVTDGKGHFRIEDFPTDQEVELHAWHPLFQEASVKVRVERGQTRSVSLVLTPAVPAAATDAGVPAADAGRADAGPD